MTPADRAATPVFSQVLRCGHRWELVNSRVPAAEARVPLPLLPLAVVLQSEASPCVDVQGVAMKGGSRLL